MDTKKSKERTNDIFIIRIINSEKKDKLRLGASTNVNTGTNYIQLVSCEGIQIEA